MISFRFGVDGVLHISDVESGYGLVVNFDNEHQRPPSIAGLDILYGGELS